MQPSKPQVLIVWHNTPPTPAQLAAWDTLWKRLLGHVRPGHGILTHARDTGGVTVATIGVQDGDNAQT